MNKFVTHTHTMTTTKRTRMEENRNGRPPPNPKRAGKKDADLNLTVLNKTIPTHKVDFHTYSLYMKRTSRMEAEDISRFIFVNGAKMICWIPLAFRDVVDVSLPNHGDVLYLHSLGHLHEGDDESNREFGMLKCIVEHVIETHSSGNSCKLELKRII